VAGGCLPTGDRMELPESAGSIVDGLQGGKVALYLLLLVTAHLGGTRCPRQWMLRHHGMAVHVWFLEIK
jgi:hypothetical protein